MASGMENLQMAADISSVYIGGNLLDEVVVTARTDRTRSEAITWHFLVFEI